MEASHQGSQSANVPRPALATNADDQPAKELAPVKVDDSNFWLVQMEAIYKRRNPHKLQSVPSLLEKYKGKEAALYAKVCKTYDLDPSKFYADPKAWEQYENDVQNEPEGLDEIPAAFQASSTAASSQAPVAAPVLFPNALVEVAEAFQSDDPAKAPNFKAFDLQVGDRGRVEKVDKGLAKIDFERDERHYHYIARPNFSKLKLQDEVKAGGGVAVPGLFGVKATATTSFGAGWSPPPSLAATMFPHVAKQVGIDSDSEEDAKGAKRKRTKKEAKGAKQEQEDCKQQ